jgi:hypothetical protein
MRIVRCKATSGYDASATLEVRSATFRMRPASSCSKVTTNSDRAHCFRTSDWPMMTGMHAEAVKVGARPSTIVLMSDARHALNCQECSARYQLHYDSDAEALFTHWSLLAQEIITARHPHHTDSVVLHRLERF